MGIYKKSKKETQPTIASAPVEEETVGEIKYVEQTNSPTKEIAKNKIVESLEEPQVREIPICLSQTQINNLIIENNIMLKQIMSEID